MNYIQNWAIGTLIIKQNRVGSKCANVRCSIDLDFLLLPGEDPVLCIRQATNEAVLLHSITCGNFVSEATKYRTEQVELQILTNVYHLYNVTIVQNDAQHVATLRIFEMFINIHLKST